MVKSVVGEESRLQLAEDRLAGGPVAAQVGLVIGKLSPSSDRGLVYDLIPTPLTDSGGPACALKPEGPTRDDRKKGSKGGKAAPAEVPASLAIDADWVAEHARQVSRMLLGGIYVVGAYVWASESSFKATSPAMLAQSIRAIAQTTSWHDGDSDERLFIHISYSPRRWACRVCTLASGSLRPCDFKMGKLLSTLQAFRCMYNFDIRVPVFSNATSSPSTLNGVLRDGLTSHSKEIQYAKALVDGDLDNEVQQTGWGELHKVELLLPFLKDACIEACSSKEVHGLVALRGSVCATAYISAKEPMSQALSDIKADIVNSLRSRLDIVSDEAEGEKGVTDEETKAPSNASIQNIVLQELREPYRLSLPRRVLVPWLDDVFISDYLQPSETFEDVKDRCTELLSMEPPLDISRILEPETETASATIETFWDIVSGHPLNAVTDESKGIKNLESVQRSKGSIFSFLMATVIVVVALLVGLVVRSLGK